MPKPNTAAHFRQFEVTCEGLSVTPEMAVHQMELEMALCNRWIKGNPETLDQTVEFDEDSGYYRAKSRIKYTDNRYKYEN